MTVTRDDRATPVLDLRLVPFAAAAWVGTAVALLAGAASAVVLAAIAFACAAAATVRRLRSRTLTPWRVLFGASAIFLMCFAGAAAARVHVAHTGLLAELAQSRASATVTVVLTDDPKPLKSNPRQMMILARGVEVHTPTGTRPVDGAVTIFAGAEQYRALIPGQHVTVHARLGVPDRAGMTVAVLRPIGPPTAVSEAPRYQRWAAHLRVRLADAAAQALSPDAAGLLPGLVVGDTSAQLPQTRNDFFASGLAHLTAVSGANVSIVLGAVLLVVRAVGVGPKVGAVLAGFALIAFVIVARPSPSVVRAAAMGSVTLLALVVGRRRQALPALGASVIVLLALWPELAVDFGFALSVAATAALIVLAPVWVQWLRDRGWPRTAAEIVSVSAAACVVTAPLVAAMTGTVSVVSVAANIAVAPVVAAATVIGVVGALAALLHVGLGAVVLTVAAPPLWWIVEVARRCASLPGASVTVPGGLAGAAVVMVLVAFCAFGWWQRRSPASVCAAALAVLTVFRML